MASNKDKTAESTMETFFPVAPESLNHSELLKERERLRRAFEASTDPNAVQAGVYLQKDAPSNAEVDELTRAMASLTWVEPTVKRKLQELSEELEEAKGAFRPLEEAAQ